MEALLRNTFASGFINTQPLVTGIPGVSPRCHEICQESTSLALLTLHILSYVCFFCFVYVLQKPTYGKTLPASMAGARTITTTICRMDAAEGLDTSVIARTIITTICRMDAAEGLDTDVIARTHRAVWDNS